MLHYFYSQPRSYVLWKVAILSSTSVPQEWGRDPTEVCKYGLLLSYSTSFISHFIDE